MLRPKPPWLQALFPWEHQALRVNGRTIQRDKRANHARYADQSRVRVCSSNPSHCCRRRAWGKLVCATGGACQPHSRDLSSPHYHCRGGGWSTQPCAGGFRTASHGHPESPHDRRGPGRLFDLNLSVWISRSQVRSSRRKCWRVSGGKSNPTSLIRWRFTGFDRPRMICSTIFRG